MWPGRANGSTGPYVADAALAIVVAVEKASPFAVSDASRAVQSMILTAWADGVGSKWAGFGGLEEVGALVGVPAELDVLAVIPFGYPSIGSDEVRNSVSRWGRLRIANATGSRSLKPRDAGSNHTMRGS